MNTPNPSHKPRTLTPRPGILMQVNGASARTWWDYKARNSQGVVKGKDRETVRDEVCERTREEEAESARERERETGREREMGERMRERERACERARTNLPMNEIEPTCP